MHCFYLQRLSLVIIVLFTNSSGYVVEQPSFSFLLIMKLGVRFRDMFSISTNFQQVRRHLFTIALFFMYQFLVIVSPL